MENKETKKKNIKLHSGIRAGFWMAFGAGGGGLQITEPEKISAPLPSKTTS